MKKILMACVLALIAPFSFGQSYPSPTYNNLTVNGTFTATGKVTTADLATQAANTVLANATASTASPTAFAMPSCSTTSSALIWTGGTGFQCNTTINANSLNGQLASFYAPINSPTFTGVVTVPYGASLPLSDDIRNYGAVCNSSGSQAANNTAITNTLAAFGKAFIPDCTIYVNNISLSSNQRIYGLGQGSNLTASGSLTATGLINCTSCNGFYVDHVSITTTSAQRATGVSAITCTTCSNVFINHNFLQGNYGVSLPGVSYAYVNFNVVSAYGDNSGTNDSGNGISIQGTTVDGQGYNCGGTVSQIGEIIGNHIFGAVAVDASHTPVGIQICNSTLIRVTNNELANPGYFGIVIRGTNAIQNVISNNQIYNSVHEMIINATQASYNIISANYLQAASASIDYCLTLDGTNGTVQGVAVKDNTLLNCYNSGIAVVNAVQFSSFLGNHIINPNSSGTTGQAGITVYGATVNYNQFTGNNIVASTATTGYGILEATGGTGTPAHNVYMSNASLNMSTAAFTITAGSTSNNNITYP